MAKYKIEIKPSTRDHARYIARNMRQSDLVELKASSISTPKEVLLNARAHSDTCLTGVVDGTPAFMFGVRCSSQLFSVGAPWMLATDLINTHQIEFLRRCRGVIEDMRAPYIFLENYVDTRNTTSIEWLQWLGFEIHPAKPHGLNQEPFHRFTMEGNKYV